ncbi:MAG: IS66 family transposase [Kofleriaceae bacterium]
MERRELEREQDIEELRRIALAQQAQIAQLLEVLSRKSREIDRLRGKPGDLQLTLKMLAELQAKAKQTQDALAKASQPKPTAKPARKPRTATGPTPQPSLPVVEQVFTLDDADRACTSCGGALQPMAGQFEESEMIDVVEVSYRVVKVKQQKYVCRCGGCVDTALGPTRALVGSRYSLSFAIKVVLDKWLDHIPLERQVRILERHGLVVTSTTLWDLANALARRLSLVDDALLAHVKAQPVIGLDQTGWPRLEKDATKPWQMWCLTAPRVVVHRIRDDKSAATFKALVGDYHGTIVADAASTHDAGARDGPGIVLAGCWAHAFRRFRDAVADHPAAERALELIGALYDIDERAGRDVARRAELRRDEAPPILESLRAWLFEHAGNTHLSIGKAAAYTLGIWDRLVRFVEDARIPLDNNSTERALRGPVVGRKNHYGSKSRRGTEVAATLYSILETAKLHDIDPAAYLTAALEAAERNEALMPWDFAAR